MKLPLAQKSGFLAAAELFKQNKNKMSGGSGGLTSTYFFPCCWNYSPADLTPVI